MEGAEHDNRGAVGDGICEACDRLCNVYMDAQRWTKTVPIGSTFSPARSAAHCISGSRTTSFDASMSTVCTWLAALPANRGCSAGIF